MSKLLYEADLPLTPLADKTVGVIGYGSQAHAHAQNLRDSGIKVIVGLRPGSASTGQAESDGLEVATVAATVERSDVVMLLIPDEVQAQVYAESIAPYLRPGQALGFAHGLNIHFGKIVPPQDIDVFLVAPKGPGPTLRRSFVAGKGLAGIFAVAQDATGQAQALAQAYARGIGCGRIGVWPTTFKEETETDLFGEQAVLCGGVPELIRAGFETLVEAGYQPEIAYFETVHEVKLIVDLIHERGFDAMHRAISNTAEFGGYQTGAAVVPPETKARMKAALERIQSGQFADDLIFDAKAGFPYLQAQRNKWASHPMEQVGGPMREVMFGEKKKSES